MTDAFDNEFTDAEVGNELPPEEREYEYAEGDDAGYGPEEGYQVGSEGGLYDQIAGGVREEREWTHQVDSLGEEYPEFQEDSSFVEEVRERLDNLGGRFTAGA